MKSYLKQNWLGVAFTLAVVALWAFGVIDPASAAAGGLLMANAPATLQELGEAFEEFKRSNDAALNELKQKGSVDPILKGNVEKANAAITRMEAQLEQMAAEKKAAEARMNALEATLQRVAKGTVGAGSQIEAKFLDAYIAMYGGEVGEKEYKEHKAALQRYLRKGAGVEQLGEFQAKAMSVDSQQDGGFWVMPDTTGRIVSKVFETSPMRQYAAVQGISTDALEGDYDLDEASCGWVGERGTRSETDTPQIGQWRIPVHEIYAEPRATQKLLDDAQVDPEQWLASKVSSKFARTEAAAFVTGDGVGKPRGFLTYASGVPTKGAWKVIEQVNTGANGSFATTNPADVFIATMGKLKDAYHNGAIWVMNRTTRAEVRKLKDADGHYLLAMDLSTGFKSTLFGYPLVSFEDMPDIAAASLSIAFANFSEAYQIVDRIGIRVLRDPYTSKPFVKFYTTKRVGGDVINHEAIKIIKFSS